MQKQMDEICAGMQFTKTTVGNVVQVAENSSSTPARKVLLVQMSFDTSIDVFVIYLLIQTPITEAKSSGNCGLCCECTVCVPLRSQGGIFDVFTGPGHSYVRDIQKELLLVPRVIAYSGYR
jgi:hypothetical protein